MARSYKKGIDYFSHDVDMMQDKKVKLLKAKHGLIGYAVYIRLLEEIYSDKGYYIIIDESFNYVFADDNNIDINVYINCLNDCINSELFDINLYEKYHILTSARIQTNYLDACSRRKSIDFIEEYLLCSLDVYINRENVYINLINVSKSTQSKVKESKVNGKESKKKETDVISDIINSYTDNKDVKTELLNFLEMRRFIKSPMTTAALNLLLNKLSKETDDDNVKIEMLNEAIINNWKSVYPLKNRTVNNHNRESDDDRVLKEWANGTETIF